MFLCTLLTLTMAQFRTSTNTCTNEKAIFKLDIRQRVQNISPTSTIGDLNAYDLCQEAYMYDYIWLTQLWTPGEYNYKNFNGEPQQTSDYIELQSIKEYQMDQALGSLSDLYLLQTNIKVYCPHMKFLGEFSFYISADSQLIQNATRFLRRPTSLSRNIYDSRYDNENFVWAVNDQMKTIPYAVPWNYFNNIVINDMKDIIYRVIIDQHKLDGIVFLQPSLGLYSVMNYNFQPEISFYGVSSFLQDFYQSLGLKENSQTLFFMGGEDNSNSKILLQNYLQQIHGSPISNTWVDMNYTFNAANFADILDDKNAQGNNDSLGFANVQREQQLNPTCIMFQIITKGDIRFGFYNVLNDRSTVANNGTFTYHGDPLDNSYCFSFFEKDIIEIQLDQSIEQFIFKKYSIDYTNFQQLSVMIPGGQNNLQPYANIRNFSKIQIKFPFQFSQNNKNANLALSNPQEITMTTSPPQGSFYFAQIWPGINQNENNVTLNFKIINMINQLSVGLCNQEINQKNNHQQTETSPYGSGLYMWHSYGFSWHNSSTSYNNVFNGNKIAKNDVISVTYTKMNSSIQFYRNSAYVYSIPLLDKVKNLNFCLGFQSIGTIISLVY